MTYEKQINKHILEAFKIYVNDAPKDGIKLDNCINPFLDAVEMFLLEYTGLN